MRWMPDRNEAAALVRVTYLWAVGVLLMAEANGDAAEGVSTNQPFRVQVRELAVRVEPRPMAEVTTSLTYKTEVSVTGTNGDWYRIGGAGWVHKSGITRRSLEPSTGSVEEFTAVVNGIVYYLTNGVANGQTKSGTNTLPTSGRSLPSPVPGSGN
jgi:hypothetical protein